ncbi:hypothetical protein E2562_011727, partial [Oryza meyeriana var. granulata]
TFRKKQMAPPRPLPLLLGCWCLPPALVPPVPFLFPPGYRRLSLLSAPPPPSSFPRPLGWDTGDPCSPKAWPGVTCDSGGRVTAVQVRNRSLTVKLATEACNLTTLTCLELFENSISGELPSLAGLGVAGPPTLRR